MPEYTLKVNLKELEVIAAGLNELPRKTSQPVFAVLQAQVEAQDKARADAEAGKKHDEAIARAMETGQPHEPK